MYDATETTLYVTFYPLLRFVLVFILPGAEPQKTNIMHKEENHKRYGLNILQNGCLSNLNLLNINLAPTDNLSVRLLYTPLHAGLRFYCCLRRTEGVHWFLSYLRSLLHQRTYQPLGLLEQDMKLILTSRTAHSERSRCVSPPRELRTCTL